MSRAVRFRVHEDIAVVTLDNPPLNVLSRDTRIGLGEVFTRIGERDDLGAVVLLAEGEAFSAGADVRELGTMLEGPSLGEICDLIENCRIPVIAALQGLALGGGMEVALAAHYRLALPGVRMGLPEIKLGLLPGAGGTQRLPRLIGAAAALTMMLSGAQVTAGRLHEMGAIDGIVNGDLPSGAVTIAQRLISEGSGPRPTGKRRDRLGDPADFMAEVERRNAALRDNNLTAPARIVECVEAALLLPFAAGCAMERVAFADLLASDQSVALRYLFSAERSVGHWFGSAGKRVDTLGIAGAGPRAGQLALAALDAVMHVVVLTGTPDEEVELRNMIADHIDQAEADGRHTVGIADAMRARLQITGEATGLMSADMVIEAEDETAQASRTIIAALDDLLAPDIPIVTTGYFNDIKELSLDLRAPGRVMGLGFANVGKLGSLVELRRGEATEPQAAGQVAATMRRMGLRAIWVGSASWGVSPRLVAGIKTAAERMVEGGLPVAAPARALKAFGWNIGSMMARLSQGPVGRFSDIDDAEVARRLLAALVNTGARLIRTRLVPGAAEIDVAMVHCHGFPRWRGGPMHWAEDAGLLALRNDMDRWGEDDPIWRPDPAISEAVKTAEGFARLRAASPQKDAQDDAHQADGRNQQSGKVDRQNA